MEPEDVATYSRLAEARLEEIKAGRAVDRTLDADALHEVREAVEELQDWIRRFDELNRA